MKFPEFEKKYPKLFFDDKGRRTARSGYWECGQGWLKIIDRLMEDIYQYNDKIKILCIKEKFGGLRVHISYDNPNPSWPEIAWSNITVWMYKNGHGVFWNKVNDFKKKFWKNDFEKVGEVIKQAEMLASKTCEHCGHPGEHVSLDGWLKTLCESCTKKYSEDPVTFRDSW